MKTNTFQKINGKGFKIAIVQARFNREITDGLSGGALKALKEADAANPDIFLAPGAFEIPLICQKLAKTEKFGGIIAIGAVIKGETAHFDYVAKAAADGILKVMLECGIPIAFGVLAAYDLEQAKARAQDDKNNKGYEAALALVETIKVINELNENF
jgi:6,7-dimethyl-8-ribityllumazine synthase